MVWYHYYAGELPALRRAIDILCSNRQEFSSDVCADLYNRFFGLERQAVTLRQISTKIETAVSDAVGMIVSANEDA
ncbi:hypothetical protein ABTE11_22850, partial [Acinetobacter baumannii]